MLTALNTAISATTTSVPTTTKCLTPPILVMKAATRRYTCQASPLAPTNATVSPLQKSHHRQQLPPSHSPLSLTMSRTQTATTGLSLASLTLSGTATWWSLQCQLRQSSPSTLCSMPPSTPQPIGLPPLCTSKRPSMLRRSLKLSRKSSNSNKSTSSGHKITDSCKLDWVSLAFLMALSVMRAKSLPQSQQEEAKWWSRNGSDWSEMGRWNYWLRGSLGNPPTL